MFNPLRDVTIVWVATLIRHCIREFEGGAKKTIKFESADSVDSQCYLYFVSSNADKYLTAAYARIKNTWLAQSHERRTRIAEILLKRSTKGVPKNNEIADVAPVQNNWANNTSDLPENSSDDDDNHVPDAVDPAYNVHLSSRGKSSGKISSALNDASQPVFQTQSIDGL